MAMETEATADATRRLALAFLAAYWRADLATALALCAPDAAIELQRSFSLVTPAPIKDVLPIIFSEVFRRFVGGRFEATVERTIADVDAVFVEYRAVGDLTTGQRFDCRYGGVFQVKQGRIVLFRQYTDTQYVAKALL